MTLAMAVELDLQSPSRSSGWTRRKGSDTIVNVQDNATDDMTSLIWSIRCYEIEFDARNATIETSIHDVVSAMRLNPHSIPEIPGRSPESDQTRRS